MFRFDGFLIFCSFLVNFFSVRRVLVLDLEPRWCACVPWWCCQVVVEVWSYVSFVSFLLLFLVVWLQTMFTSSTKGQLILDRMARSFHLGEKVHAGWEGWLEGACLAQVKFEVEDAVHNAVL
jgi:hypothetical protein